MVAIPLLFRHTTLLVQGSEHGPSLTVAIALKVCGVHKTTHVLSSLSRKEAFDGVANNVALPLGIGHIGDSEDLEAAARGPQRGDVDD